MDEKNNANKIIIANSLVTINEDRPDGVVWINDGIVEDDH